MLHVTDITMPAQTILLDFSVDPASMSSLGAQQTLSGNVQSALSEFLPGLQQIHFNELEKGFLCICTASKGIVTTVRGFPQGLLTVNIEYFKDEEAQPLLSYELTGKLEGVLSAKLGSKRGQRLPALGRGGIPHYFITSDERLLEYDIDAVLFEEKSPYQKVQIVHSRSLGNMLLLDDLQNISECDMIYTETLMQRGKEDYRNKEICILGGGDGALLWELLKEEPKFVTMLELDDVVMKACSKHLRSLCGTCLDQMSGPNYEIIVDDCVKVLDRFVKSGKKFDYVFGDLTDVPISPTPQGELWDFIRHILNTSLEVLKPGGKYMTHANGASSPASLKMLEDQLSKLVKPVDFTQDRAFVPSFLEEWVFYQIIPKTV